MLKNKRIRLVGKRATFNAEVWARAVEALARQLQREAEGRNTADKPKTTAPKPETSS